MVLLIGLAKDTHLSQAFQRLESLSAAIFEAKQTSRERLSGLLAEHDKTSKYIETNLKSLTRVLRIEDEQYRQLEEAWNDKAVSGQLAASLFDTSNGLEMLRKVHHILGGTSDAAHIELFVRELRSAEAEPDMKIVFWATSEENADAIVSSH